jgi:Heparinase II/III-like protein/Heparinase II/III N-terminus
MSCGLRLKTYLRLGVGNLARVGWYRMGLRTGLHPAQRLKREIGGEIFFGPPVGQVRQLPVPNSWLESALYFGWHKEPLNGAPPRWHRNPFNGRETGGKDQPWWRHADFDSTAGDIKTIWEASRFDWVLTLAQRAAKGDARELARLNSWLSDWCAENQAYLGANWKCGQEASLRVLHLALAAHLLGQDAAPPADLVRLLEAHLARIQATLGYALAQDNNHGTSEAAALFVGGTLCEAAGVAEGAIWAKEGRHWLENRARKLIAPDGAFSQYSLNYHRFMLDTLSLAEFWRQGRGLPPFSPEFLDRARCATDWLYHLVEPESGAVPNFGANDGANLLPLTGADSRDFRPSVQLAMALFWEKTAFAPAGHHDSLLSWLRVNKPEAIADRPLSRHFPEAGYVVLRQGNWTGLFKYPAYRFRPHHCDALHLDLWHGSQNILRDAGTYGYNSGTPWCDYFPGTGAHNTVAFDDHDQMPKVGRFLLGAWLKARNVAFADDGKGGTSSQAGYSDFRDCAHVRSVRLDGEGVRVKDQVGGFRRRAILRWRLQPGSWELTDGVLRGSGFVLRISADVEIARLEVVEGWESLYYLQKSSLPVLEIEVRSAGTITTEIIAQKTAK